MSEKEHKYHVIINMIEDRVGDFILDDKNKPVIRVATPPEFPGGKPGIHSAEELFVGAIASCKMTTFCAMAEKLAIGLKTLKIEATGYLGKAEDRGLMFTEIAVKLYIGVDDEDNKESTKRCVDLTNKYCLITNSVKSKMNVTYEISIV